MKKLVPLFIVCLAAASVAVLAFANNVAAVVAWWSGFAAAGGDTAAMPAHVGGFVPWLDWSVVRSEERRVGKECRL